MSSNLLDWKSSTYNRSPTVGGFEECKQVSSPIQTFPSAELHVQCTALDRLTGGSTIVLHHPGATPPGLDISPENLKAEVYINPKVLSEHRELHLVVAQISQLFIANYATPLAQAFAENRIRNNWKGSGPVSQMPSKGKTTSKGKQADTTPLIPSPISPSSAHFTFYGRPRGSLEGLMTSTSNILLYIPSYDSRITWKPTQIRLMHTQESKGHQVRKEGPSRRTVVLAHDHSACQAWRHYPPTTPTRSKSTSFKLPTPTSITARPPSDLRHYSVLTLVPFGNETEVVLEELGYPDHFHQVCISIGKDYLPKRWFLKLQEVAEILEEHAEAIANAMLTDSQELLARTILAGWFLEHAPQFGSLSLNNLDCRYLERLSLGSVIHHHKRNKTSAWHAYMHFKGIQNNANKSFSEKSNIADLAKGETKYHQLTTEEKAQLIIDFDKVKKSSQDRPPNITTRSRAANVPRASSW
ncbi:uncharacterized protein F5147DRAFT_656726 [Suillus discolor]|uniref:Uncharacterized protein n=1 Tax=Suillus discolor TaxID=1912936 RepID=A0A9P7JPM0_9AGAM|nr:uncharacterized protein F5147DRAFT_656726 [Suillus discolor]KAG2096125.1 hypothetical protein F5147DRAFT_656726 [Suillus discolor]